MQQVSIFLVTYNVAIDFIRKTLLSVFGEKMNIKVDN